MTGPDSRPDLLVIGGGVIGLSVARDAALRGLRVLVLERGEVARGATHAAAGMLSPLGEASGAGPSLDFGLRSLRMYRDWVRQLEEEAGLSVEYREAGKLRIALAQPEVERLEQRAAWARGLGMETEWFEPGPLRKLEGTLAHSVRAGLLVREDFRIDARALGRALEKSARRHGVEIRQGCPVRSIRSGGGRVHGVLLEDGARVEADSVLVAAGAWSGSIGGIPHPVPVRPVRGQMLALLPGGPPSAYVIESEEIYLVPRDDGRVLVGATVEEAAFEAANTAEGVRRLLNAALRLTPGLGSAALVELWSGFRPATEDGVPILGPDPDVAGLLFATGHYRNGILLAPATARAIGSLAAGEDGDPIPPAFTPGRLAEPEESAGRL